MTLLLVLLCAGVIGYCYRKAKLWDETHGL